MDLEAVQRQAQSTRAMTDSRIADIRANKALSDGGKRQLIAVEVKRCADALEKLRLETQAAVVTEREALERKLWANISPADVVANRDALARAAALKDPDEARSLFRRATLSGDQQLARAIALEPRWSDLTADYRRQDPGWGADAQALIDHDRSTGSAKWKMNLSMITSTPVVPELSGASTFEVTRLAAAAEA